MIEGDKMRKLKSRAINNSYKYFPQLVIEGIPYKFEIELSGKVYYRNKNGELRKADSIKMKHSGYIIISIDKWTITVKGFNKENKWVYEVINNEKIEEEGESENTKRI